MRGGGAVRTTVAGRVASGPDNLLSLDQSTTENLASAYDKYEGCS
eukprot:CAMPEP_0194433334 /NCGR_PEP_ID=MMETSP0176-20130528/76110_1 /TAXON_ID=216777 /ORGANISM="Proboscia alata, Strain PI-D3" /LENGTH=44 /DNA_ID= /DNA_START= /DNA_END= /DNA_ORIENTATION=